MRALIVIDIQNDFCPGGALEVKDGDQVVGVANRAMKKFDLVVATQDWHPATHGSFAANHPWRRPGNTIQLNGLEQILWPIHCVQGSFGAEFVQELDTSKLEKVFAKGTDPVIDSYSGFYDNGRLKSTGLAEYLRQRGTEEVYILGLALDYCVKYSVLDALQEGFKTHLILDGCRAVNVQEGDGERAVEEMVAQGAVVVEAAGIKVKG